MHSCMTDAIGQIENHDVVIASLGYRSEARPVVRHVVHHRFPGGRCTHHHHFVAKRATRIVRSGYELDHCFPLSGLVRICITRPMEEWCCQMRVCHDGVSLSKCNNNHLELELYIKLKFSLNHSYAQTTNKLNHWILIIRPKQQELLRNCILVQISNRFHIYSKIESFTFSLKLLLQCEDCMAKSKERRGCNCCSELLDQPPRAGLLNQIIIYIYLRTEIMRLSADPNNKIFRDKYFNYSLCTCKKISHSDKLKVESDLHEVWNRICSLWE